MVIKVSRGEQVLYQAIDSLRYDEKNGYLIVRTMSGVEHNIKKDYSAEEAEEMINSILLNIAMCQS